jgi:peptidoglycan/xylan/chitin deacetylase (PgdA/CDA1 family)
MHDMKNYIKRNILPAFLKLNIEQLYHLNAKGKILNIFYHGVVKTDSTNIFPRHIAKEQFEQHMKYLSQKFNIISIDEAFYLYKNDIKPDKKSITVSFDDGYLNNLTNALPIIEKYKVKTTFFISGICAEDDTYMMWSDIIAFARHFSKSNYLIIGDQKFIKYGRYDLINEDKNISIFSYIKNLPYAERDEVLKEIKERYLAHNMNNLPLEFWKLMNRDQIKELSESEIVSIGSHGYLHYNLANITESAAKSEMEISKKILSEITGKDINLISFPDGSYNDNVKKIAIALGYDGLLAVDYRCKSDLHDKNILNRWGVSATTTFETIAFSLNKAFIKYAF